MTATIEKIRVLMIEHGHADVMMVAARQALTVNCGFCGGGEPHHAHAIVWWRFETDPTTEHPDHYNTEEVAVCLDSIVAALDLATQQPGFCAAQVEVLP